MNCNAVQLKLAGYIDGELSGFEMIQVRSHLADCSSCNAEAEAIREVKWIVNNLPQTDPGEDFKARLKSKVFAAPASRRTFASAPLAMISTAAFVAALFCGLSYIRSTRLAVPPTTSVSPAVSESHGNFELARDQAYASGTDPLGGAVLLTADAH